MIITRPFITPDTRGTAVWNSINCSSITLLNSSVAQLTFLLCLVKLPSNPALLQMFRSRPLFKVFLPTTCLVKLGWIDDICLDRMDLLKESNSNNTCSKQWYLYLLIRTLNILVTPWALMSCASIYDTHVCLRSMTVKLYVFRSIAYTEAELIDT